MRGSVCCFRVAIGIRDTVMMMVMIGLHIVSRISQSATKCPVWWVLRFHRRASRAIRGHLIHGHWFIRVATVLARGRQEVNYKGCDIDGVDECNDPFGDGGGVPVTCPTEGTECY